MSKKLVLIAGVVLLVLAIIIVPPLRKTLQYSSAVEALENKEYEKAQEIFSSLSGYKEADKYLKECMYQNAISDLEEGKLGQAITTFELLGTYKDSEQHCHDAQLERKYALFNKDVNVDEFGDMLLSTPDETEDILNERIYGTWYEKDSGAELTIDFCNIGQKAYGIKHGSVIDYSYLAFLLYYCEDSDHETSRGHELFSSYETSGGHELSIGVEYDYFEYIEESIPRLSIYDIQEDVENVYYRITPEEYSAMVAENEEAMSRQPTYTDKTIIDKTFSTFKSKIRSYYSGPSTLYHTASYSDAYVTYDWESQTYFCSMTAVYSTNGFDFWGTSDTTYFVNAAFLDTGYDLTLIDISIQ